MPQVSCSVYNCANNSKKLDIIKKEVCSTHNELKGVCGCLPYIHFKFPKQPLIQEKWVKLINRQKSSTDTSLWHPSKTSVVCSIHFENGKPTVDHPLPTKHLGYNVRQKLGCSMLSQPRKERTIHDLEPTILESCSEATVISMTSAHANENHNMAIARDKPKNDDIYIVQTPECLNDNASTIIETVIDRKSPDNMTNVYHKQLKSMQARYLKSCMLLKSKSTQLKALLRPKHRQLLTSNVDTNFYTGLPNLRVFASICKYLKEFERQSHRCKRTPAMLVQLKYKKVSLVQKREVKMVMEDKVLLTLMKIRLSLLHKDLADRFRLSVTDTSKVFTSTIKLLAQALKPLIVFYQREKVSANLPKEYSNYKNIRCIIDCSELFIQKPSDLKNQAATWSDYKHHNTVKFLIAITPQGSIAYLSELYGGRTSDRHIVKDSNFLHYINPHDQVLADRGFPIREELLLKQANLILPPAAKGAAQMTSHDVKETKKVANVRIHVERVIRCLKHFRILSQVISVPMLRYANDIIIVCAAITNLQGPIVKTWSTDATLANKD